MFRRPSPAPHPAVGIMAMQGRTKRDFARHADYSEHYVGTVLRGLGPVSAAFAGKLSEYLDRPVDELFDQESAAS